jgi:hypothetical protein
MFKTISCIRNLSDGSIVMKTKIISLITLFCFAVADRIDAQTLNWGNVVGEPIVTSEGNPIDNTFVFQLGAFDAGFVPEFSNANQWLQNWRIFDTAAYDSTFGFSTATAYIRDGVTSAEPGASTLSFAGLDAYIWIRNADDAVEGSEWLLTRASTWKFPITGGDCCDTTVLEWSVSDLDSTTTPIIGGHNGVVGPGVFTPPSSTTGLQTHTFIPEPSSVVCAILASMLVVMRRRRNH